MPPRPEWWPHVRGAIRRYPALCAKEAALHDVSITPSYEGMPGRGRPSDKTADAALRTLPPIDQVELDAVRNALRSTEALPNGHLRCELIRLNHFRKSHTLMGAALKVHVSERTATTWNSDFIREVARQLGLS